MYPNLSKSKFQSKIVHCTKKRGNKKYVQKYSFRRPCYFIKIFEFDPKDLNLERPFDKLRSLK